MSLKALGSLTLVTLLVGCSTATNPDSATMDTTTASTPTEIAEPNSASTAETSEATAQATEPQLEHTAAETLTQQATDTQVAQTSQPAGTETASEIANPSLTRYTSICEEGPCNDSYHTLPTLEHVSGTERLLSTELVTLSSTGEPVSDAEPVQVLCSTQRPIVIKDDGAGGYVLFHLAPHQITSDEDMNVTSLYWSICHNLETDSLTPDELSWNAGAQGYSLDRTFSVYYSDFYEFFEGEG